MYLKFHKVLIKIFDISQLNDFIGESLECKTKELINGKRKFSGKLTGCNDVTYNKEIKSLISWN